MPQILTQDLTALRERHESLVLTRDISLLESALGVDKTQRLMEDWGDFVSPMEFLYDDPSGPWMGLPSRSMSPPALIGDRDKGQEFPFFRTEAELAQIRGSARIIAKSLPSAIGIRANLANYVIGNGFSYKAEPAKGVTIPDGLDKAVDRVVQRFCTDNDWVADRELEVFDDSLIDGEVPVVLYADGWRTKVRAADPSGIREPSNPRGIETWLECETPSCWKFGVHTDESDIESVFGYYVQWTQKDTEWDYLPSGDVELAKRLGTGVVEFIKRNTGRRVTRGLSDFYPVRRFLQHADKVLDRTSQGAATQASIAWVEEYVAGTSQAGVQNPVMAGARTTYQKPTANGGSRTMPVRDFSGGTVIHTTQGKKFLPGPMGSERNVNFLIAEAACLRMAGTRWCMPEYMVSGDASNSNYSSTMVAESPFVKACEREQGFLKSRYGRIVWKAVAIAHAAGYFDRFDVTMQQLEQYVEIVITAPEVAVRDKDKDSARRIAEVNAGLLSEETAIEESGRDPKVEIPRIQKEKAERAASMPQQFGQPAPVMESFDETQHPRDDHGRFVSGARLAAAKSDPKKAAELRAEVTDPEQRKKLDAALGDKPESDLQRGVAAAKSFAGEYGEAIAAPVKAVFAPIHHALASRFGITPAAVKSILDTPANELRRRDEYLAPNNQHEPAKDFEKHPLGTAKIGSFGDPHNSYVEFMHEFNPHDLTPTEPEDGIKKRDPSYPKYVEWFKQGIEPPPVSVVQSEKTGKYLSQNRRRTLAAQEAGTNSIKGWLSVNNKETGNPLKYGDIIDAAKSHSAKIHESIDPRTEIIDAMIERIWESYP